MGLNLNICLILLGAPLTILVAYAIPLGSSKASNVRNALDILLENRSISVLRLPDGFNYRAKGMEKTCRTCPEDTYFREVCPEDGDQLESDCPVCPPGTYQPENSHLHTSCVLKPPRLTTTETPMPTAKPEPPDTCGGCPEGYTKTACSPTKVSTTICCPGVIKPNGNFDGYIHVRAPVSPSPTPTTTFDPGKGSSKPVRKDDSTANVSSLDEPIEPVDPAVDKDGPMKEEDATKDNETDQNNALFFFLGFTVCSILVLAVYIFKHVVKPRRFCSSQAVDQAPREANAGQDNPLI